MSSKKIKKKHKKIKLEDKTDIKKPNSDTEENITEKKENNKEIVKQKIKNRSIAVQLIAERLLSEFFRNLFIDIAYTVLLFGAFLYNAEMEVNGSIRYFNSFEFSINNNGGGLHEFLRSITLIVCDSNNGRYIFSASHYGEFLYTTLGIMVLFQTMFFLLNCFAVPIRINRKLKPLYTMTQAARALNYVDLTSEEFSTLQDAINKFSPNDFDDKIHTGKKEFMGMEDAINDLLERMRNSYKSQIRFVSDASHELRTPIAVIQGYANMLDRWGREDKEILDESIASIKSEAENMNRLVENLLFLARGDSGRTVLRLEEISINQLMCDIYDEFVMIDSSHEFILDLRAEITSQADTSLIKQCLRILVDNAIKYSPANTDIILRLQKRDETYFAIEVQDYGIGVKSEDADKIFERFYRSDPARNRQNGGSGLGLSIAKWIADKHNGYFELLSYENLGTRISLILPFIVDPQIEKNIENSEKNSSSI